MSQEKIYSYSINNIFIKQQIINYIYLKYKANKKNKCFL